MENVTKILETCIPYLRESSKETFWQKLKEVPHYMDKFEKQYSENAEWRELAQKKGAEFLIDYEKCNEAHVNEIELAIIGIEKVPVIKVKIYRRPYCRRGK